MTKSPQSEGIRGEQLREVVESVLAKIDDLDRKGISSVTLIVKQLEPVRSALVRTSAPAEPAPQVAVDLASEELRELLQSWRNANAHGWNSPIGPLHGAGMYDGVQWCIAQLERALAAAPAKSEEGKP